MAKPTQYIRQWRKYRNLTQLELSVKAGVDATQISRIENGKRPYDKNALEQIAQALDCEPGDLLMTDPGARDAMREALADLTPYERRLLLEYAHAIRKLRGANDG